MRGRIARTVARGCLLWGALALWACDDGAGGDGDGPDDPDAATGGGAAAGGAGGTGAGGIAGGGTGGAAASGGGDSGGGDSGGGDSGGGSGGEPPLGGAGGGGEGGAGAGGAGGGGAAVNRPRDPAETPEDPLAGGDLEACEVYLEARCVGGVEQRCAVRDVAGGMWVDAPDPLFRRALLYDRWYDLHHQPLGQTADRRFNGPILPGTTELDWGDPDRFFGWAGAGDSAIWTGVALHAAALRYLSTGTDADYARMARKARALLLKFEVTGIPGYLARYHGALVPPGTPPDPARIHKIGAPEALEHRDTLVGDAVLAAVPALAEAYADAPGQPFWHGNPSIDQYTGAMVALPLVVPLLRDDALRARAIGQLTCYLNRLRRLDVVNLQQNPEILGAVQRFFAGGALMLDPEDPDFGALDRISAWYLDQPNAENRDTFDRSCPGAPAFEATRTIDVTSPRYAVELVSLAQDLQSRDQARAGSIDHIYVPSVRGGDAVHLMHLALMAWHWTGDAVYLRFLDEVLVAETDAIAVAGTAAALTLPPWCRAFFGGHITYPAVFGLARILTDDSPLRRVALEVLDAEFWRKSRGPLADAKFDLMYGGLVPADVAIDPVDPGRAVARGLETLADFGAVSGQIDEPRRAYTQDPRDILDAIAALEPPIGTRCPSPEERALCEGGFELLGVQIPGETISRGCRNTPGECAFDDGLCADPMADAPLPARLRPFTDFLWQRNPFEIGHGVPIEGFEQSPGLDLTEPFWLARHLGLTDAGAGQVLAWQDTGACE
jgi:hypothetical protein